MTLFMVRVAMFNNIWRRPGTELCLGFFLNFGNLTGSVFSSPFREYSKKKFNSWYLYYRTHPDGTILTDQPLISLRKYFHAFSIFIILSTWFHPLIRKRDKLLVYNPFPMTEDFNRKAYKRISQGKVDQEQMKIWTRRQHYKNNYSQIHD